MKKVEAIIRPFKLEDVKVESCGSWHHRHDCERSARLRGEGPGEATATANHGEFLQKLKIEAVVEDDRVEDVVKSIADAARTGGTVTARSSSARWNRGMDLTRDRDSTALRGLSSASPSQTHPFPNGPQGLELLASPNFFMRQLNLKDSA